MTDATLLDRFGLVTEEQLAELLGVSVKTLRNRGADVPAFVKSGHRRLYREESVREYFDRKTVAPGR